MQNKKYQKLQKQFVLFLLLIINVSVFSQSKKAVAPEWVLFGEHSIKTPYNVEKEYHIHIDRNGDFYPEQFIADTALRNKGKNQLRVWAKEYSTDFSSIAAGYQLEDTLYSAKAFIPL